MLRVEDLYSGYKGIVVLHGVSLIIQRGEIVSLVGLNGAGKSTLLKTLSGMLPVIKGKIYFEDADVTSLSPDQLIRLGLVHVPENRHLFPSLTVEENLLLGTAALGKKFRKENLSERFEFVFEMFPILKNRLKQHAGTLSGGEQQMLAIGRGLMSKPRLLLLDEPTLGLAPIVVEKIFEVLIRLKSEGLTIFLVEQNVAMSLEISDRAYVLDLGRIKLEGTGKELLNDRRVKDVYLGGFAIA